MDSQQRGRSPSNGPASRSLNHSRSPSAQAGFNKQANAHGTDPTLLSTNTFEQRPLNQHTSLADTDFLHSNLPQPFAQEHSPSQTFDQFPINAPPPQFENQFEHPVEGNQIGRQDTFPAGVDPRFLVATNTNRNQDLDEFLAQDPQRQAAGNADDFETLKEADQTYNQTQDPNNPFMASFHPSYNQPTGFQQVSGTRSRGQSLSPSSAAGLPGQISHEWGNMAFQGHRRNPSADAFSDVSSHHSPYVDAMESFDLSGTSPNLQGQADHTLVNESLGNLNHFSISDPNVVASRHASPGPSNHVSPHISPQPGINFETTENFGLFPTDPAPSMLDPSSRPEAFPNNVQFATGPEGAINPTPEINIQLAPERQPSFHEANAQDGIGRDALSPPSRSKFHFVAHR